MKFSSLNCIRSMAIGYFSGTFDKEFAKNCLKLWFRTYFAGNEHWIRCLEQLERKRKRLVFQITWIARKRPRNIDGDHNCNGRWWIYSPNMGKNCFWKCVNYRPSPNRIFHLLEMNRNYNIYSLGVICTFLIPILNAVLTVKSRHDVASVRPSFIGLNRTCCSKKIVWFLQLSTFS